MVRNNSAQPRAGPVKYLGKGAKLQWKSHIHGLKKVKTVLVEIHYWR